MSRNRRPLPARRANGRFKAGPKRDATTSRSTCVACGESTLEVLTVRRGSATAERWSCSSCGAVGAIVTEPAWSNEDDGFPNADDSAGWAGLGAR